VQATQLIINETLIIELRENVDLLLFDKTSTCCFILAGMLNVTRVDVSSIGFAAGAAFAYYFSLDTNISESPIYLTQETVTIQQIQQNSHSKGDLQASFVMV
jgi:hypothetical protein